MELFKELSVLGDAERETLARALLTALEGGGEQSHTRDNMQESAAPAAPKGGETPLAPTPRRSASLPDGEVSHPASAGEALPMEQAQRNALLRGLETVSFRRAALSAGGGAGAFGDAAGQSAGAYPMEAAALPDAEALSAAVRRAARREDGGYERY
jgi:hypothetical protein